MYDHTTSIDADADDAYDSRERDELYGHELTNC